MKSNRIDGWIPAAAIFFLLSGLGAQGFFHRAALAQKTTEPGKGGTAMSAMTLTSTSFKHSESMPKKHTCQGADVSVPLAWSGVPSNARSLALIVDDPDAPDPQAPKTTWLHWVLYNIPVAAQGLPEGVTALPRGTLEGKNDWKRQGYGGPCPPIGRHRYFFKLYALDTVLPDLHQPTKAALEQAMKGHILAQAELIGTYEKSK